LLLAEKFHTLSHIFISLIGAVLLLAIWYNIRWRFKKLLEEDESQKRIDRGLAYLGASLFVWVLAGVWAFILLDGKQDESVLEHGVRSLLSTLNNFFLLKALFYFAQAPKFIYKNEKSIKLITVGVIAISALSIILFQLFGNQTFAGIKLSFLPDFLLSSFVSYLLAVSIFRTFMKRNLKVVAFISVGIMAILFYSQLPEVFVSILDDAFVNNLMRIVAKTALISIFLVLATNWVMDLAHTPKPSEMMLKLSDWSLLTLSVPSKNIINAEVDFGSKTTQFRNLLKFALRRKFGEGDSQYIEVGNAGEIARQTYLTRIIENLNQILGKEADECLERKDLFTFVGQGKYRLRILPENISFNATLLEEFIKEKENEEYELLVSK
jgi:hypothetical protein